MNSKQFDDWYLENAVEPWGERRLDYWMKIVVLLLHNAWCGEGNGWSMEDVRPPWEPAGEVKEVTPDTLAAKAEAWVRQMGGEVKTDGE